MPVDPNIALQVQTPDTATPIYNAVNQDQAMKIKAQQELKLIYDNASERDKMRLQSVIGGAAQLKPFLDSQDYQGAENFLTRRKNDIQTRINNGETWLDTTETDDALTALKSKNYQELHNSVNSLIAAGQFYGLGNKDLPSGVEEYNYFKGLSPQEQQAYLNVKRNPLVIDLGDKKIINPSSPNSQVLPVGLKPQDQPDNAKKKEQAKAEGKAQGEENARLADMQSTLPQLETTVKTLSDLGKKATYTLAGQGWNAIVRQSGQGATEGAKAREEYINTVRDVLFPQLRQTFGGQFTFKEGESLIATLGDPNKSPEEKDAALRTFIDQKKQSIQSLQRRAGQQPAAGQTLNWSDF